MLFTELLSGYQKDYNHISNKNCGFVCFQPLKGHLETEITFILYSLQNYWFI